MKSIRNIVVGAVLSTSLMFLAGGFAAAQNDPSGGACAGLDPSGGLFSTASDIVTFYQMVLAGGVHQGKRIISKQSVELMTSRQTADDIVTGFTSGNGWGLGWCVVRLCE